MGFRVDNYSLSELHRIAVPGAVAPSLFWALPVGRWNHGELEDVWRWFTEHPSECNDYGLLLVKEMGRRERRGQDVSLASVGAKLSDLMPAGTERFLHPRDRDRGQSTKVLVLSGGYPQPGWGVLVEWREQDIRRFEHLVQHTIESLQEEATENPLRGFKEAAQAFHIWRNLRRPESPNVSGIKHEIESGERPDQFLREAKLALEEGEHRLVGEKIIAAIQATSQAAWLEIPDDELQLLLDTQRKLLTATSVLAVPEETIITEIEPQLEPLLADRSQRESAFRNLSSDGVKHALKACLHLRTEGLVEESGSFVDWANQVLEEVPAALAAGLEKIRSDLSAKLVTHRGSKAQMEHEHQVRMDEWRQSSMQAREAYHTAAGNAAELQWTLGPKFLVAFEKACRDEGLWTRSIPWDPARMVGWKITASQVELDSRDLQIAARELVPDAAGAAPANGAPDGAADGSYFTDYVHHIAISKPGFSPRAVTRDLLARLLRPAEMMSLIEAHTAAPPTASEASFLAEEVLHAFGWHESDDARARPLAGCIKIGDNGTSAIAGDLSGNDLRIATESFCKDVIDVVVSQLGYRHTEVWRAIEERIPGYRPSSRAKDWEEEVRRMTLGSARMLVSALGPLAFAGKEKQVSEFAAGLGKLTDVLNAASHDREGESVSSEWTIQAPALVRELLCKAEAFLGDLPWHMEASFVYGEQPKVLSGEAWSHGSPTPRLLRVIVWSGGSPGTHVTFWNKERRNPVVPDPVFIVRPKKGHLAK